MDVGVSATYPWNSLAWLLDGKPHPDVYTSDAYYPLHQHTEIHTDPLTYKCAMQLVNPQLYKDPGCLQGWPDAVSTAAMSGNAESSQPAQEQQSAQPERQVLLEQEGSLAPSVTQTISVPIGENVPAVFTVYTAEPVSFTLVDPTGRVIDPQVAEADSTMSYVAHPDAGFGSGWFYQYQIDAPTSGTWQQVLQATNAGDFVVVTEVVSAVGLQYATERTTYRPGSTLR